MDHKKFDEEFDRTQRNIMKAGIAFGIVYALVVLTIVSVGIWAIVTVVQHFTG